MAEKVCICLADRQQMCAGEGMKTMKGIARVSHFVRKRMTRNYSPRIMRIESRGRSSEMDMMTCENERRMNDEWPKNEN